MTHGSYSIPHYNLGLVYLDKGAKEILAIGKTEYYTKAVAEFKQANSLRPDFPPYLRGLGTACYRNQDNQCADENYQRAIQIDPNDGLAYLGLAELHRFNKAYQQAQANIDQVVKILKNYNKGDRDVLESRLDEQLGILAFEYQRWNVAVDYLTKAMTLDLDHLEVLAYYRASSYGNSGDIQKACKDLKKYLNPNLTPSQYLAGETDRRKNAEALKHSLGCAN